MPRTLNVEATLSRIDNDLERLDQLYQIALEELPRWEKRMREKIDTGDTEQIRKIAHAYKGSSATLGAEKLQELLMNLENDMKNSAFDKEDIEDRFQQFTEGVNSLIDTINEYLNNKKITAKHGIPGE